MLLTIIAIELFGSFPIWSHQEQNGLFCFGIFDFEVFDALLIGMMIDQSLIGH